MEYIHTIFQIIATFALVGVTVYYAIQTRNTVDAVKAAAELSIRPHLKGSLEMLGSVAVYLMMTNTGNGPASRINLEYYLLENMEGSKKIWVKPLLMPKDKEELFIPNGADVPTVEIDFFQNNQSTLRITGEYFDMLDERHIIDDSINITEFITQFEQHNVLDMEAPLVKIEDHLKGIKDHLNYIRTHFHK